MREILGRDDTGFRVNFGVSGRIPVTGFGLEPPSDEEALEAFPAVEVPVKRESFALGRLEKFFPDFLP
ncbi:MAG: hypothetical protein LBW85_03025 [Deltaproteobacteria bacterium]|jgi:hypothetical protein|nr:hypothetical protein [Deltaproteobacteria bacterium]